MHEKITDLTLDSLRLVLLLAIELVFLTGVLAAGAFALLLTASDPSFSTESLSPSSLEEASSSNRPEIDYVMMHESLLPENKELRLYNTLEH